MPPSEENVPLFYMVVSTPSYNSLSLSKRCEICVRVERAAQMASNPLGMCCSEAGAARYDPADQIDASLEHLF